MIEDLDGRMIGAEKDGVNPDGTLTGICIIGDADDGHVTTLRRLGRSDAMQFAVDMFALATGHEVTDPYNMEVAECGPAQLEAVDADLPEWDRRPNPWQPTAAQQARAIELYRVRLEGTDSDFERALISYARDLNRDQCAPAAIWALLEYGSFQLLIDAGHRQTAVNRMRQDLSVLREEILNEEGQAS